MLVLGLVLFGVGLTGLVTALGGLFAVDICPKRVAGAAMGLIGIFSYGSMPPEFAKANIRLFAEKVLPRLKAHEDAATRAA